MKKTGRVFRLKPTNKTESNHYFKQNKDYFEVKGNPNDLREQNPERLLLISNVKKEKYVDAIRFEEVVAKDFSLKIFKKLEKLIILIIAVLGITSLYAALNGEEHQYVVFIMAVVLILVYKPIK